MKEAANEMAASFALLRYSFKHHFMIRFAILFLYFVLAIVELNGQIVWEKRLQGVPSEVLSILPDANNELHLIGIHNKTITKTPYRGKKTLAPTPLSAQIRADAQLIHPLPNHTFLLVSSLNNRLYGRIIGAKDGRELQKFQWEVAASIQAVCQVPGGDWVMVGQQQQKMFAMRVKTDGTVVWQKSFGGRGALLDVVVTPKGRILMVGFIDLFQSGDTDYFITEFDLNGKNKWEKVLGTPENLKEKARLVSLTADENILVVGSRGDELWMMQLDKGQVVTWEDGVKSKGEVLRPTAIYSQSDGTTVVAIKTQSEGGGDLMLMELNTQLMTSTSDLLGHMQFKPIASAERQRPIVVHYKNTNRYYQVTSDVSKLSHLELHGRFPSSHFIYVLGINQNAEIDVLSETKSGTISDEHLTTIDLQKYDYLILLLSDDTCNIDKVALQLRYQRNMIRTLPKILGDRLFEEQDVLYISHELAAYARFDRKNRIVPFFIKLK